MSLVFGLLLFSSSLQALQAINDWQNQKVGVFGKNSKGESMEDGVQVLHEYINWIRAHPQDYLKHFVKVTPGLDQPDNGIWAGPKFTVRFLEKIKPFKYPVRLSWVACAACQGHVMWGSQSGIAGHNGPPGPFANPLTRL